MPNEVPAALPLIAYIAGLTCGFSARDAIGMIAIALLLALRRRARACLIVFCAALGIINARPTVRLEPSEDRFITIQAPIDRDWSRRGDAFLLRVQFRQQPLTIYARFEPKPIEMQKWIRVEGFLRPNDRGELTMLIKSPRLLEYRDELSPLDPAAWNRALANRLRPFARQFPHEVALVEALALGRGERLADEIRDNYKRGGTYHLLVFSGLQIAFAAGVIAFFLRSLHAPRASDWLLLIFSILAPMFIGPTASVSRASIGIGLYAISRILKRPTRLENLWCVAALLRLIIAPHDLTDAAFQLTYAGAGALLFIGKPLAIDRKRWLAYAIGAECAVTPLTLFHFHQYALGGSLTTLALTPVISAMLIVSALICAIPCAPLFQGIRLLSRLCAFVNGISATFAGWHAAPTVISLAIGFGAALSAIAFLRGRSRAMAILGATLIPIIAAIVVAHRSVSRPVITVIDVGQGDSILIRTPNHAVLVDGGPRYANVAASLLDRGVRELDAVVLTHVHPDHCGGLPDVMTHLHVRELWVSPRRFEGECAQGLLDVAASELVPIHLLRDGEVRRGIQVLLANRTFKRAAENNSSVVLRVRIGERTIVLTGDIEHETESDLADRIGPADVLKVAHHGSRSSSTAVFLNAVSPRVALISCGRRNLFGHPHREVLNALQQRRIQIFRTDVNGSVELEFHGDHVFVHRQIDTPR
ncbi:MAG: DNA internalization-related competence protein ComEC/Rec2 [Acidobacteria bacterium]|nr:MAG: DNA internalization-related competence protein ComEC/Rec2 [Acidobacteriota bacterium]